MRTVLGVSGGYHLTTHHGQQEEKIRDLITIDRYQTEQFARFLEKLSSLEDESSGGSFLDDSMVLFGSGMGNASSHSNKNLPLILAGGGFRHGEHKSYQHAETGKSTKLATDLFVSMLQRFGLETDSFGMSTSTLTGLEVSA